ncbi:MAG: HAMP domain-containing histidine kinase [Candidatus Dormibacteraeota bacterium]|nr:HAMP domain-containing histidine kinase [Candidatus Dormibacteraeota bacterium]
MSQELARPLSTPPRPARSAPNPAPARPEAGPAARPAVHRDRRAGVERAIELSRWIVLVFAEVTNNFPGVPPSASQGAVNLLLGGWALFNLAATLLLFTGHLPGRRVQLAMTGLDIGVASGLVYLTGGFTSELAIAFYLVIIAGSLRFRMTASLLCTLASAAIYFAVGYVVASRHFTPELLDIFVTRMFLLFVVALTSNLLARELVTARDRQIRHTIELEHAAFAELREVDRIKSEFMMLASHELRTPLTKIKAWLTLMQDAGDRLPPDARDEGLLELRQEAEHLARLTDNLLCIAQLESGEIRLKTTAVELESVFREVISRFVESADQERFAMTIAPDAERVLADHERLALVLACLIDNALKFSPDSEPVVVTATRVVNKVHVAVQDNGRRIPDRDVDRVFASFYQVESPLLRQRGGFGVGLYLSRQLVERMGGEIWIDNTRARGNTFIVALPMHV